jgi:predicted amidohydrolase
MLVNVALVQHRAGESLSLDLKLHLLRKRPDFVCFPEYWGALSDASAFETLLARRLELDQQMQGLSKLLSCVVVGGTRLVKDDGCVYNSAPVFDSGRFLGDYAKAYPTANERKRGIAPGPGPGVWRLNGLTIGVAICADSLEPGYFAKYGLEGTDLLFVPNASPLRPGEPVADKLCRDADIFVQGARAAGAYVIKVCSVGAIFGGALQGRSLVAAPWDVLYRVAPEAEDRPQVIAATLSIAELREFRAQLSRPVAG